ncbi:ATP-dependent nuclease [Odoribacter lunatus]|uniref:ATP-dependent nuclease n=1 Tax=Odoribacter lunatus TaxID=2941335 RepID=UPI00203D39A5|nr:AAA family ATPase [Odoribacter lunatus]
MKQIRKIEIKNYRSIKTQTIKDIEDFNIFSGGNDVGKSNVLRALDLFFNDKDVDFFKEFNIARKAEIKKQREKQIISIKLWFHNDTYKNLPPIFSVKKIWDKSGKIINIQNDIGTWLKTHTSITEKQAQTSLSLYLNRFRFKYIPAIKDDSCFNQLLIELYNAIVENTIGSLEEFESTLASFNQKLLELSKDLSLTFRTLTGIESAINIPTSVNDLARRLSVETYTKDKNAVPLFNRGDGVRMQYIPSILNFISTIEKNKWHIWAIDEPETSCEYVKTSALAKDFLREYCLKNQIFISSHSFHFITLEDKKISRYRVYIKDEKSNIINVKSDLFSDNELKSELGIYELLAGLQDVYDKFVQDCKLLEENIELIHNLNKVLLLFEGKSDRILFRKAITKLNPDRMQDFCFAEDADQKQRAVIGEGADSLYGFLTSHIPKINSMNKKIIAIFDNDEGGKKQYNKIKKDFSTVYNIEMIGDKEVLKHKKYDVYVFCLQPPIFRKNFVNDEPKYCYLSTELLLQDSNIPENKRAYVPHTSPVLFSFKNNADKLAFASSIDADADYTGFNDTLEIIFKICPHKTS